METCRWSLERLAYHPGASRQARTTAYQLHTPAVIVHAIMPRMVSESIGYMVCVLSQKHVAQKSLGLSYPERIGEQPRRL